MEMCTSYGNSSIGFWICAITLLNCLVILSEHTSRMLLDVRLFSVAHIHAHPSKRPCLVLGIRNKSWLIIGQVVLCSKGQTVISKISLEIIGQLRKLLQNNIWWSMVLICNFLRSMLLWKTIFVCCTFERLLACPISFYLLLRSFTQL